MTMGRKIRKITVNGETLSVNEWAEKLDVAPSTLWARFARCSPEEAILKATWRGGGRPRDPASIKEKKRELRIAALAAAIEVLRTHDFGSVTLINEVARIAAHLQKQKVRLLG